MSTIKDSTNLQLQLKVVIPIVATIAAASVAGYIRYVAILNAIHEGDRYNWLLRDQREWAKEVKQHNTNVWVPDPNDIFWESRGADMTARSKSKAIAITP